ncbi:hypothetical protein GGX14DRAFT_406899 [Mycena pura]|uniref:Uncharacterized protein n=1 Tax=Mycena pura TaxID=153505 RepID=A0AAD6UP70_9AGAR|nr:hypothetical protein GGX14DRAFT_406899 [Mycena pura]
MVDSPPNQSLAPLACDLEAEVNARLDAPLAILNTTDSTTNHLEDLLTTPLPGLTESTEKSTWLYFPRAGSPTRTDPGDGDSDEELDYIVGSDRPTDGAGVEPGSAGSTDSVPGDIPLPPSTSSHSMRGQTVRTFQTRAATAKGPEAEKADAPPSTATSASLATTAAKKKRGPKPVSRSVSTLTMTDMAPDDAGVMQALGLVPRPSKELAADERARTDYNVMQLVSAIAALQTDVAESKKGQIEYQKEILRRLADQQLSSPTASASLSLNTTSDVSRLKKVVADGRDALSKLTGVVTAVLESNGIDQDFFFFSQKGNFVPPVNSERRGSSEHSQTPIEGGACGLSRCPCAGRPVCVSGLPRFFPSATIKPPWAIVASAQTSGPATGTCGDGERMGAGTTFFPGLGAVFFAFDLGCGFGAALGYFAGLLGP